MTRREHDRQRRHPEDLGQQVEGRRAVRELLSARTRRVHEVWMSYEDDDIAQLAHAAHARIRRVPPDQLERRARTSAPQGVIAFAVPVALADLDLLLGDPAAFLVALDGVTDPGNLGAVLRSAECAGATGVALPKHRAVHVTPAATKAAAGAIEYLPMTLVGGLPAAISRMRGAGLHVVGLDGAADTALADMTGGDGPVCVVLGAEGRGLSRLVRERCDEVVSIPLRGRLGSLNVSAAAALACYEVARRR
jgi:23S rRNA (guanosine2251-2'-O)-methyltransferase